MTDLVFETKWVERLAIRVLCAPFVCWLALVAIFAIKKQFVPNISEKQALRVDTWLVGQRFLDAGVSEIVTKSNDGRWEGKKSAVVLKPESDQYSFESPLFEAPAVLKFDGYRWTGFTSKAGRGMPIAVEMWPD